MKPHTRKALFFSAKVMTVWIIVSIVVMAAISNYARQQDGPLYVYYLCATGAHPPTFVLHMYDNGTHTIDRLSCKWIKNADPELISAEHAEIRAMYCSEMLERHESGEPYLSFLNDRLAESKAAGCKILKPQYYSLAELFFPWL